MNEFPPPPPLTRAPRLRPLLTAPNNGILKKNRLNLLIALKERQVTLDVVRCQMSDRFQPYQRDLNPKALIAFEKVAQHGSITRASEDLNVAASSVSRYIKLLEHDLGVSLFHRESGKLTLNGNGKFFYNEIHHALNRIRWSSQKVAKKGDNHIRIWCYPVVASEWLLPRIEEFYLKHNAHISVITGLVPPADTLQYCDVAILSEESILPNYKTSFLFAEKIVPVCTSGYLKAGLDERGGYSSLITSTTRLKELRAWNARHENMLETSTSNRLEFDQSVFAVAAARKGLGITLAADVWVASDLIERSLTLPFGKRQLRGYDIHLAWGQNTMTHIVQLFTMWVIEEMKVCQTGLKKVYQDYARNEP